MKGALLYTLYVISVLWIAGGTFLILYTEGTRKFLKQIFLRNSVRWMAIFPFVLGLILVVGAFYYREMFWLAFVLGLLALLKGVYLAIGPSSQVKGIFEWWFNQASDGTIRLWGLITFILGSALLSYLM